MFHRVPRTRSTVVGLVVVIAFVLAASALGGAKMAGTPSSKAPATSSAAKAGPFTIGLSEAVGGTAWREFGIATLQALANHPNYKPFVKSVTIVRAQNNNVAQQAADIRNLIAKKVDLIILNAASPTALEPVFKQADQAGIPVVGVNQPLKSKYAYSVQNDCYGSGLVAAQWLAKKLKATLKGKQAKLAMVQGIPGASCNDDNYHAALKVFKANNIEVVVSGQSNWDESQAQTVLAQMMTAHPELNSAYCVFCGGIGFPAAMAAASKWMPFAGGEGFNGEACNMVKYKGKEVAFLGPSQQSIYAKGLYEGLQILRGRTVKKVQAYGPLQLNTDRPSTYKPLCFPKLSPYLSIGFAWPGPVPNPKAFGKPLPLTLASVLKHYKG